MKGKPCAEAEFCAMVKDYNDGYNFCDGSRTKVFGGMAELVARLNAEGFKTAVVSNKAQDGAEEVVKNSSPRSGSITSADCATGLNPSPTARAWI